MLYFPSSEITPTSTPAGLGKCPSEINDATNERINCIPEQFPTQVCKTNSYYLNEHTCYYPKITAQYFVISHY
jgi:hypothetical protein